MKIISISDIHGDFETFDKALKYIKNTDAEVLTINGDLSGSVFNKEEKEYFVNITNNLRGLVQQIYHDTKGNIRTFHDSMKFLISGKIKAPKELMKLADDYLRFEKKAVERMSNQYQEFKDRFNDLEQKIILVPGNWDGKCIDDVLAKYNIHNRYPEEIDGIRFIGYGGSREHPIELPIDLTVHYYENEAFSHLSKHENAEVVLIHTCPKGFEGSERHTGEYSLLAYLYRNAPSLILTGNTHRPFIVKEEKTSTIVANPGNLGRYQNQNFGTFLELEIDKDFFVRPLYVHKIDGDSIKSIEITEKVPQ